MAPSLLTQFPTVPPTDLLHGDLCTICHEPYAAADPAVRLPCGHEFGLACLSTWLSPRHGNSTCPLCRRELLPINARREELIIHLQHYWNAMASDPNSRLGSNGQRGRPFGYWLLESQLQAQAQGQGVSLELPPWRPVSADRDLGLDGAPEEAPVGERRRRRRGALRALPGALGRAVSRRRLRRGSRASSGVWSDAAFTAMAGGCPWIF